MTAIVDSLLRPGDDAARQSEKLRRIAAALVRRAEAAAAAIERQREPRPTLEETESPYALFVVAAAGTRMPVGEAPTSDASEEARDVIDALPLGVCIFDRGGRLAFWNRKAESISGAAETALAIGLTFVDFAAGFGRLRPEDRDALRRLAAWSGGEPARPSLAVELRARSGPTVDVRAQDMPQGGILLCLDDVSAERDALRALDEINDRLEDKVSERTEALSAARDAAEAANVAKSRFLAAAGHDLLQPLNAARLFLGALDETSLDSEQHLLVERLGSSLQSVDSLLNAILDISRLEKEEEPPSFAPVDLAELFEELRREFELQARAKGLELRVVPTRRFVLSEAALLRRVLQNLLANAVRYTPSGRVVIGARRRQGAVAIEVRDTGPGIAADFHEAVFEEFRRLDHVEALGPTTADGAPGMGLGLAIVRRACQRLGHSLDLVSDEGRGSCFRVVAPSADDEDAPARRPSEPSEVDLEEMVVLVVHPSARARADVVDKLERWGACPMEAGDLIEAVGAAADLGAAPDMILSAAGLPDGATGLDAVRTLRAYFGPAPAAILVDRTEDEEAVGRAAESEDVDLLPLDDGDGRLRAALAVAHEVRG
ncbi:MAG: ATP-binding protein [Pseudomonadota bacterium]